MKDKIRRKRREARKGDIHEKVEQNRKKEGKREGQKRGKGEER